MSAGLLLGVLGITLLAAKGKDGLIMINPMLPSWNRYDALFKHYVAINSLPPDAWKWLKAICLGESQMGEHPLVKAGLWSSDGLSKGIMQLTVATANDYEKWFPADVLNKKSPKFSPTAYDLCAEKLNDPDLSIRVSAKHFSRIYRKFGNVLEHAVKAYNQGEGNMAKEIALRASRGVPLTGFSIPEYPAAATYWSRFAKHLAQVEAKP